MAPEPSRLTLGEELKRCREALGISLREISEETRIGSRFLKAIEGNQFSILPGGIFNRSFIRAFARHVDFSEELALQLYSAQQETAEESGVLQSLPPAPSALRSSTFQFSSSGMLIVLGAAWTAVLALMLWAGIHFLSRNGTDAVRTEIPADSSLLNASSSRPQESSVIPEVHAAATVKESALEEVSRGPRVEIKATQGECWVSYSLDRQMSTHLLLVPGEQKALEPRETVVFTLGNARAVEVRINGRRAVFEGIVVKNVVVNRENYQKYLTD